MKVELFPFQKKAVNSLRINVAEALGSYHRTHTPQVVSFTAPTGSGKTIIMAALIEDIYFGTDSIQGQPESIFVWLSDSPQLNEQSKQKIDLKADRIRLDQCVVVSDESFDKEYFEDGHIYFLNTQKLGKSSNLGKHGDGRQYTIWETLTNTVREKSDRLYFIIDEAHRGMQGKDAGRATSIMQKFLKGSPSDKLNPMPVVIGMSATIARFNNLVEGTTSTVHKTAVSVQDVRASGLLKERIVITYPEDANKHSAMAVLEAAADQWKEKCIHWYQYSYEQHYAQVNPVFVVQVENGTHNNVSNTDLEECIEKIENRTGYHFKENEVVHTFGQTGNLKIRGLDVPHIEPSDIAEDKRIRVVFFKENLSTGWDCPRAETMMSFRRAVDNTSIAQLLGRMVRTPLQCRVMVDESLNDVHLYLPFFNAETVQSVIDELQNTEGGEIPTVVDGESIENSIYVNWTSRTYHKKVSPIDPNQQSLFDNWDTDEAIPFGPSDGEVDNDNIVKSIHPQEVPTDIPVKPLYQVPKKAEPALTSEQIKMNIGIDRDEVVKFINDFGLLTYAVKSTKINDYLISLLKLARLLTQSGIAQSAIKDVENDMVEMIHDYIVKIKDKGTYKDLVSQVLQFKLLVKVIDVFGESVDNPVRDLISMTETDLDRQLHAADQVLGNTGISNAYGRKFYDEADPNAFKIDVILFAISDACLTSLNAYAETTFHRLNDENRKYVINQPERYRKQYKDIIADGDAVSKHNFCLPEILRVKFDSDGTNYDNHLYVDEEKGYARIKLNGWEQGVLEEESKQNDFVCWLRNPPRENWSLCIPYEMNNEIKPTFPDFIVIRSDAKQVGGYAIDILEPHSPDYKDNLGKAKGFAKYAEENLGIGRIQLIRMGINSAGKKQFKRLDLSLGEIRKKVLAAINNDELDHIFDTDGFFMKS